jgi:putative addiction module component (TIGR02574 family)
MGLIEIVFYRPVGGDLRVYPKNRSKNNEIAHMLHHNIEDLWDSIAVDEDSIPVPESNRDELDKRLKRYKIDPCSLLSLSELQERIEKRK